ncbi:MAG TPA: hydroxysqualene dehydroxylase HpnE [Burkholderiales bacterium]|nr:hydroxysqualene dehydroxylase HpnE [Burkholderiales bacterium]
MAHLGHGLNRVAVVGAGWAGLAAAVTLAGRGVPVTVFEASRSLGGRARRVSIDGVDLDNGQHVLIGAYRESLRLMRQVGADPERLLLRMPLDLRFADGFHLRAPRLPYPLNLAIALLGAKGLLLAESLSAVRFMASLRLRKFRIDPDRSVAELLDQHGQPGALRSHLWEPLCVSALNTPVHSASAQVFTNVLRDGLTGSREASDFLIARTDLGKIFPEPAAEYVKARGGEIRLGEPVRRVARVHGGFRVNGAFEFSSVVIACAPQHAGQLLVQLPELADALFRIGALAYEPIATCYLQYPESVSLPAPMLGFTGGILQWVFDRGRIGGPKGLLASVISASGEHEALPKDALVSQIHSELQAAQGPLPEPKWSQVITEKRATFSCRPGLERPEGSTALPGLLLAGDYVAGDHPGTLEAAVRSGVAAATRVTVDSAA